MMLAYNIYDTFYARSGPQWKGIGQAKAVVFFPVCGCDLAAPAAFDPL